MQVDASFSPFRHPAQVNASRVTSINLLLAYKIEDSVPLKCLFLRLASTCEETCEPFGNPTQVSTQVQLASTSVLRLLAGPFGQSLWDKFRVVKRNCAVRSRTIEVILLHSHPAMNGSHIPNVGNAHCISTTTVFPSRVPPYFKNPSRIPPSAWVKRPFVFLKFRETPERFVIFTNLLLFAISVQSNFQVRYS